MTVLYALTTRTPPKAVVHHVHGLNFKPSWNDNCTRIWEEGKAVGFSFDTCCLET